MSFPCLPNDLAGRQFPATGRFPSWFRASFFAVGQQDSGLSGHTHLTRTSRCDQFGSQPISSYNQRFGWSSEQIDPDLPNNCRFASATKALARPKYQPDRLFLRYGHRADRLNAAKRINLVSRQCLRSG
jgi:hypothetical protein